MHSYLAAAPLVVCDLSDNNPNVAYEAGFRAAAGLPVVFVCDSVTDVPFVFGDERILKYEKPSSAREVSDDRLYALVKELGEVARSVTTGAHGRELSGEDALSSRVHRLAHQFAEQVVEAASIARATAVERSGPRVDEFGPDTNLRRRVRNG